MSDASSESEPEPDDDDEAETEEGPQEEPEDEDDEEEGAQGATPGETPAWDSSAAPAFDEHMQTRMELRWNSNMNPSVKNAGEQYAQVRATPKAPRDGWYSERYVCATLKMEDMDEERDFEFLIGDNLQGIKPPERVCFAMKGMNDDFLEMLSRFLDETSTRYGDQIKAWREEGLGVKQLFLADNPITDAGAAYLADALKNNQTVEEIYLSYTNVNDKGLQHFLDMLKQNKTLKKLELGNCGITDSGAKNVIKAFDKGGVAAKNNTLEHLGLFNNDDAVDPFLPQIMDIFEPEGRKARGGK